MKLATRISSICRTAWNTATSCSPASDSMCALSLASHREAGCTRSPRSASTRVTGSWVSQSISRSGCRARSSSAIARSRRTWPEPDRRADVQRTAPAVAGAAPGTLALRLRGDRFGEVADQPVRQYGFAHRWGMPAAADRHQLPAGPPRQRHTGLVRHDAVAVAVDHEDRAAHCPADRLGVRLGEGVDRRRRVQQGRGVGLQAPADTVLPMLDRVRLGEDLGHEELDPTAVVGEPVVPVRLRPAVVAVLGLVEVRRQRPGQRRPDRHDPGCALRVPGRELQGVPSAQGEARPARRGRCR